MSGRAGRAYACGVVQILLVEDEPMIASFVSRGLRAEGYATAVAGNGDDALAELDAREWDLVVLDLKLPGVDGFGVLARAIEADPPVPVLVLSAQNGVATKVAALDAGASDYLAKPFSFDELLARVRACLRRQPRDGRPPARARPAEPPDHPPRRWPRPAVRARVRPARVPAAHPRGGRVTRADSERRLGLPVRPAVE